MIKIYTARTSEIDEINEAIDEIRGQIDFTALAKNSGGLIFCHSDFVESGVVKALCEALPFGVIGMTTIAGSNESGYGVYDLVLTILTSDEVSFETAMSGNIDGGNYISEINRLTQKARKTNDVSMALTLIPYVRDVSGCDILDALDKSFGGVPMWGGVTSSVGFSYDAVQAICDGVNRPAGMAVMFLRGPVSPRYILASVPESNIYSSRAVVTKSEGALIKELNGLPVRDYLLSVGLNVTTETMTATPMMVYYKGSNEPVALAIYTIFDDGSILTGGHVPAGSSIAMGVIDAEGIYQSTKEGLERVLEEGGGKSAILMPCGGRYIMLAPAQDTELRLIEEMLAKSGVKFGMGYAGGEISPVPDADGKLRNRFHNFTFNACVFGET